MPEVKYISKIAYVCLLFSFAAAWPVHAENSSKILVDEYNEEASIALAATFDFLGFVWCLSADNILSRFAGGSCSLVCNNPGDGAWVLTAKHVAMDYRGNQRVFPFLWVGFGKNEEAVHTAIEDAVAGGVPLPEALSTNHVYRVDKVFIQNSSEVDIALLRLNTLSRKENGDLIEPVSLYRAPLELDMPLLIGGYGRHGDPQNAWYDGTNAEYDGYARAARGNLDYFSMAWLLGWYWGWLHYDYSLPIPGMANPGDSGGMVAVEENGQPFLTGVVSGGAGGGIGMATGFAYFGYSPNYFRWLEISIADNRSQEDLDGDNVPDNVDSYPNSNQDSDGDELPDDWENHYFGNLDGDGTGNSDPDTLIDREEFQHGCSPLSPDTDGDTVQDDDEVTAGISPANADTDNDHVRDDADPHPGLSEDVNDNGLPDDWEYVFLGSASEESYFDDQDGLSHYMEFLCESDPRKGDTDNDGVLDGYDANPCTNWDTDSDGLMDDWEWFYVRNTLLNPEDDNDEDFLTNSEEVALGTNPANPDTDDDYVNDSLDPNPLLYSDSDGDGLSDDWEVYFFGFLDYDADDDPDGDQVNNGSELWCGMNPNSAIDSDGDGLPDDWERLWLGTLDWGTGDDPDVDNYTNLEEFNHRTNPASWDTDGDQLIDSLDPNPLLYTDSDGDGLSDDCEMFYFGALDYDGDDDPDDDRLDNATELYYRLNPNSAIDSDGDGLADDWERLWLGGLDWGTGDDPDVDNYTNLEEFNHSTNPNYWDTDGDQLIDSLDPNPLLYTNSDGDGLSDDCEMFYFGCLDYDADDDPDDDRLDNATELYYRLNPNSAIDSDNDGLPDDWERYWFYSLDYEGSEDTDLDGLLENDEYVYGTNPHSGDTDGDGVNDGAEVTAGTDPTDPSSFPSTLEGESEGEGEVVVPFAADTNADWRIVMSEAIGYLAGWQQGSNPLAYAIRAAYIWQKGERYTYDAGQTPPLCWTLID